MTAVQSSSRDFQTNVESEVRARTYERERQLASKSEKIHSAWVAINASERGAKAEVESEVGRGTYNPVVTYSLTPPGFNPCLIQM